MSDLEAPHATTCADAHAELDGAEKNTPLAAARKNVGKRKRQPSGRYRAPWIDDCLADDSGRPVSNLANVLLALRRAPELVGVIGFDQMAVATVLRRPLPVAPGSNAQPEGETPRRIRDEDLSQLQEWLQHAGLPKVGREVVYQAVAQRARECSFHPVKDKLRALQWDGVKRLDTFLVDFFGVADTPYTRAIGRMFVIAMVARILRPGCKVDYMLILEGAQGLEKSKACQVLAGEYFSDDLPDIHAKDARLHLRGKWLIEVAELAAIRRAETEALKSFLTRSTEIYRPPYGREDVHEPRQCVFVGTTNSDNYLVDPTGARRFWPVKVTSVSIEGLKAARDQILAEAVSAFRAGEKWWPSPAFERQHIAPEQEFRQVVDPWTDVIAAFVEGRSSVRPGEIADKALHLETGRLNTADFTRIANLLKGLGWTKGPRTKLGQTYVRGDASPDDAAKDDEEQRTTQDRTRPKSEEQVDFLDVW